MPIRTFRTIEEMNQPHWREPGDPDLLRAIADLWETGRRTSTRTFPPGLHKFTSIEEMQRAQEDWSNRRAVP